MATPTPNVNMTLMEAILTGSLTIAAKLIREGAPVNIKDKHQGTPLVYAVSQGSLDAIHVLKEAKDFQDSVNAPSIQGNTALTVAIIFQQWEIAKELIRLSAKVNLSNDATHTPLMNAVAKGYLDAIPILAEAKDFSDSLNVATNDGNTALMMAIGQKKWEVAKELIRLGANMHAQNKIGYTPMILLSRIANTPVIHQLLSSGVITTHDLKTAQEDAQLIAIIKEVGHILGLKTKISNIQPEGMEVVTNEEHPAYLLLNKYLNKLSGTVGFQKIQEALHLAIKFSKEHDYKELIEYYQNGNCTILPGGWSNHGITLIAWNNILVVCNRGDRQFKEGISVFKIPDKKDKTPGSITEEFLKTIIPDTTTPSPEAVLKGISDLLGQENIDKPILTFPSLTQKYGTCSFVNLKSSLQPILCFMKLLENFGSKPINLKEFNYAFLEPYLTTEQGQEQLQVIKRETRNKYKEFTKTMRDQIVTELCADFKNLALGSKKRDIYLRIFIAILYEHYGRHTRTQENKAAEIERTKKILSVLAATHDLQSVLEEKNDNGHTILMRAIYTQKWELAKELIRLGANAHVRDDCKWTALIWALSTGYLKDIAISTETKNFSDSLNAPDTNGDTALLRAIQQLEWKVAQGLIQLGAKVNVSNNEKHTPLILVAAQGYLNAIPILLEAKDFHDSLNAQDKEGTTALLWAILNQEWKIAKELMKLGADMHIKNSDGHTPMTLLSGLNDTNEEANMLKQFAAQQLIPPPVILSSQTSVNPPVIESTSPVMTSTEKSDKLTR